MNQSNQPMTTHIHLHIHSNQDGGQPTVEVQHLDKEYRYEPLPPLTITSEMRKFYEDKTWRMIVLTFSDYLGKLLEEMHPDEADKAAKEIIDALLELEIPPDNYFHSDVHVYAMWLVPEEKAFCRLSPEQMDLVNQHFIQAVSEIGISTPWAGDIGMFEDLNDPPYEKYQEHVERRARLRAFDRMAGLQVSVRQK